MSGLGLIMGFSVFSFLMFYFTICETIEERKLKMSMKYDQMRK
jgi:hypothetical protein